jgi:hypothetical protein
LALKSFLSIYPFPDEFFLLLGVATPIFVSHKLYGFFAYLRFLK